MTAPVQSEPGATARPTFAAPNVTVAVARTAAPATSPVEALTPDGTSTATTGRAAALISSIIRAASSRGGAVEPDPEQRVDDDVRVAEVADTVDHRHLPPGVAQHARADSTVTAVLPLAADDRHAAREATQHELCDGGSGTLHQVVQRPRVGLLGKSRLRRGQQRQEPHRVDHHRDRRRQLA